MGLRGFSGEVLFLGIFLNGFIEQGDGVSSVDIIFFFSFWNTLKILVIKVLMGSRYSSGMEMSLDNLYQFIIYILGFRPELETCFCQSSFNFSGIVPYINLVSYLLFSDMIQIILLEPE